MKEISIGGMKKFLYFLLILGFALMVANIFLYGLTGFQIFFGIMLIGIYLWFLFFVENKNSTKRLKNE